MRIVCLLIPFALLAGACASFMSTESPETDENIPYEVSILRKSVTHLQRENEVIRNENLEYRREVKIRQAEIDRQRSEIAALKAQHERLIADAEQRYRDMQAKAAEAERDLLARLGALEEKKRRGEAMHAEAMKAMADKANAEGERHRRDEEAMKKEFAEREFQFGKSIAEMKNRLDERERAHAELKNKAADMQRLVDRCAKEAQRPKGELRPGNTAPPAGGKPR